MFLFWSTAGSVCMVCDSLLSRLLVGFRMHLKSMHFHFISETHQTRQDSEYNLSVFRPGLNVAMGALICRVYSGSREYSTSTPER